jgi:hypothetical protein
MVMRILLKPFALAFPLTLLVAAHCPAVASQELERVIAAEPTPAGITITVATGGCSKKADFEIASSPVTDGKASIELRRTKPDPCKGNFPDGLKLQFGWAELKLPEGTQLALKNVADPVFGSIPPTAVAATTMPAPEATPAKRHYRAYRHRRGWRRHHHRRHIYRHRSQCFCPCFED